MRDLLLLRYKVKEGYIFINRIRPTGWAYMMRSAGMIFLLFDFPFRF